MFIGGVPAGRHFRHHQQPAEAQVFASICAAVAGSVFRRPGWRTSSTWRRSVAAPVIERTTRITVTALALGAPSAGDCEPKVRGTTVQPRSPLAGVRRLHGEASDFQPPR